MSLPEIITPKEAQFWRPEEGARQKSAFDSTRDGDRIDLDMLKSLFLMIK